MIPVFRSVVAYAENNTKVQSGWPLVYMEITMRHSRGMSERLKLLAPTVRTKRHQQRVGGEVALMYALSTLGQHLIDIHEVNTTCIRGTIKPRAAKSQLEFVGEVVQTFVAERFAVHEEAILAQSHKMHPVCKLRTNACERFLAPAC